jgi:hypothetical protein
MTIPDVPELREVLSGMRLSPDQPTAQDAAVQLPFLPARDETGYINERQLWLHYLAETKIPFKRLIDRINKELHISQHPRHNDFALFALALAILIPSYKGNIISRLNKVLGLVCEADVSLYHILSAEFPEQYRFDIPPFNIGPLRVEKLRYNSKKAGSDYYSRYRDRLANSWAVEREPRKTKVFDIPHIREEILGASINVLTRQQWEFQACNSIVDGYFSLQNSVLFEQFLTELVSAQSILLALGAPFFDSRSLYMLSGIIRTHRVAIFRNLGARKEGFVAPGGMGPLFIDVAGIHERVPRVLRELRESYGFERFDDSPLHRSMKLFADFVARARRHEIDHHPNEALLHYVIALELIFGERQTIQKSVSERVGLITFRENRRSFEQQRDWIDKIYNMRSRYVHDGIEVTDEEQIDQLRRLCEQTFRCLLRLQAAHPHRLLKGENVLAAWLRELDYLVAGFGAGKQPAETQLAETFILQ